MESANKYFLSHDEPRLDPQKLDAIIRHALIEDIGKGDITTQLTIPKNTLIKAEIICKEDFVVCGFEVFERIFKTVDKKIKFYPKVKEGQAVKKGKIIARIEGKASSILSAERVGLNLLSLLSGVATKTREFVKKIAPYKVRITDTRKTFPGLRDLQKYAVRIGGGFNHRMALDEMIIIKDNHLQVTGGYIQLPKVPKGFKIEIEVQNLSEFIHALRFKPDVIMLDNMSLIDIKKAVKIRNNTVFNSHHPRTKLEASGGVDIKSLRQIAAAGVEIVSIGELTHSVRSVDISLEVIK
ncbi:MAG: carboxylating nicotinate-nucleotide diphosphorylase [Candidatus Omnitrophota bacterium]|nr:carboxylating nicotinate-nucleotide diphosphorylase [Candidatus Omnitrophota bacterium]